MNVTQDIQGKGGGHVDSLILLGTKMICCRCSGKARKVVRLFRIALISILFLVDIGKYLVMSVREDYLMSLLRYHVLRLLSSLTKSRSSRSISNIIIIYN